jgi:hypothetical protein
VTFKLNKIIQGLSVASALGSQYSGLFTNPKTQAIIVSGAVLASSIAGLLAQFSNPDGTPAEQPYKPTVTVPKMPSNYETPKE